MLARVFSPLWLGAVATLAACHSGSSERKAVPNKDLLTLREMSDADVARLSSARIFFGHQSVGYNLVEGIGDVMKDDSRLHLNIVETRDVKAAERGGFLHAAIGRNVYPAEKDADFFAVLDSGFGRQGDIAFYKYCYVDVQPGTNVPALFAAYKRNFEAAKAKYPELTLVHVTMPLMASEGAIAARWKSYRTGYSQRALNAARNQFNRLMLAEYGNSGLVFDLARAESTKLDGSREFYRAGSDTVYSLVSSYTNDGGHLRQSSRKRVADQLLAFLARVNAGRVVAAAGTTRPAIAASADGFARR